MYWIKTPEIFINHLPQCLWRVQTDEKKVFLTFDDGPEPSITPYILDELDKFKVKATFFVIGKNVQLYPDITIQTLQRGHQIGNHTHTHCNGWKTKNSQYFEDIEMCQKTIEDKIGFSPFLFRPPYGKLTPLQIRYLAPKYRITMMDILCGDFDLTKTSRDCTEAIISYTQKGSIIVYHDSLKAADRMKPSLPQVLAYFSEKGWEFCAL